MRWRRGRGAGADSCTVCRPSPPRSVTARDPLHNSRWFCLSLLLMLIYRPEERELSPAFKLPDVSASSPRSCRVRGAGYPGSGSVQQPTHLVSLDLTSAVVSLRT
jgi:hypothetical protein